MPTSSTGWGPPWRIHESWRYAQLCTGRLARHTLSLGEARKSASSTTRPAKCIRVAYAAWVRGEGASLRLCLPSTGQTAVASIITNDQPLSQCCCDHVRQLCCIWQDVLGQDLLSHHSIQQQLG